ncbi:hypothetical protein BDV39DRAFT_181291 [Aspergillus sergii]|uniref:Uncharacterized protein n=1 Tax=Aspergillus sergii TaxID=1034303 RepID=A0A5N6WSV0_9EURO|nr:hypothetical protein BDV39DRAFT_181291 [Aspergillus sergii]
MSQHIIIVVVYRDTELFVLFVVLCALDLFGHSVSYSYNTGTRNQVDQGVNMAFAHPAKASNCN